MFMRIIITLILASVSSLPTSGQEWVRLGDGQIAWARPAPTLIPQAAPIVLKTHGLRRLLSKLWFVGGKPFPRLAPGGALVELARILNSQPGMKAVHLERPIYFGFYHPSALEHVRTVKNATTASEILQHAVVVLPITSEKKFYRSLDSRFERIKNNDAQVRLYRLQADQLDYEAWTKATLAGRIDPQEVAPEGFARSGDNQLYCRSNGTFVAMTANPTIAKDLARLDSRQQWTLLETPSSVLPQVSDPTVATRLCQESFLNPRADITVAFRLVGKGAVGPSFFKDRLNALINRFESKAQGSVADPGATSALRAFSQTLVNLVGADFEEIAALEASLVLVGTDFDVTILTKDARPQPVSSAPTNQSAQAEHLERGRVPQDVTAAGWGEVSLGSRLKKIYVDLIAPLSGLYWPFATAIPRTVRAGDVSSLGTFTYYLDVDPKRGFLFVESLKSASKPSTEKEVHNRVMSQTILGRTLFRVSPDRTLRFHQLKQVDGRGVYLYRFVGNKRSFIWEHQTALESALSRLVEQPYAVAVTWYKERLIYACAEHPLAALRQALALQDLPATSALPRGSFANPPAIEFSGYFRPRAIQDFLMTAPRAVAKSRGHVLRVLVGRDQAIRQIHLRGPIDFLGDLKAMLAVTRFQRQTVLSRQRMLLLRRALLRQIREETAIKTLSSLFEAHEEKAAVLPPYYRFALNDAWGRPFILREENGGKFVLKSLGEDGAQGGSDAATDLVLVIQ